MNPTDTVTPSQQALAEGFARRLVRWARAIHPEFAAVEVVSEAARQVCLAMGDGHACTDLSLLSGRLGREPAAIEAILLESRVVGRPDDREPLPLVLDAEGRLYLYRYFDYERRLAAALLRLAKRPAGRVEVPPAARTTLAELFGTSDTPAADWQKIAAALALLGRLTIISGGPGTGKTTTVVNLLACLLAAQPECRIALAAPTGKAAARLLAALQERAEQLPAALRQALPQSASTIHRLLGVLPQGGFRHHAEHPLAVDVLVVDEASMLDLALAVRLVEAIPPGARLILLGDKDQLAAVEAGAVFSELAADPRLSPATIDQLAELTATPPEAIASPPCVRPTPLHDRVLWFSRNYRFHAESGIGRLAGYVNRGDWDATRVWLERGDDESVRWLDRRDAAADGAMVAGLLDGYRTFLDALQMNSNDPAAALDAFGRFRVLCATRSSARGVAALNRALAAEFRRRLAHRFDTRAHADWFPGRPVLILRNDYALRLFNGDIGIALADAAGALRVHFPDSAGAYRAIPPLRLPEHETAFAMTVHKSQGSEFEAVALVLPGRPLPVVTRELLYTGITRARQRVDLLAGATVLAAGIATATRRHSGLIARLNEEAGASADPANASPRTAGSRSRPSVEEFGP
ncbi:exodeoxyribonuclease V subunit alpha [Methylotetracoccus oryzae]|uniref:exodeoxyribonuclease V subunit alpha n=1 Tax=Methylotetracoccus oryzae TaxID=1919059 RepID=UPI00111A058C|nr:exodeoxyribonuclease V subunit alpha [Methylotetracoccus oryzae]